MGMAARSCQYQIDILPDTPSFAYIMTTSYIKRYRMEIELPGRLFSSDSADSNSTALPYPYEWVEWTDDLVQAHADAKYACFRNELDTEVFPCLGERIGCLKLMRDIASRESFLPVATWLIQKPASESHLTPNLCGTIQGVCQTKMMGAIQNVGIVSSHRGQGLGRALVCKSLEGFQAHGVDRVFLEVTADNEPAVLLYQSIGFKIVRMMFKAINENTVR